MTKEEIEQYYSYGNPWIENKEQMEFYSDKAPDLLYKYNSDSSYSISNLLCNQIWYSNPNEFNDPFECRAELDVDVVIERLKKDLKAIPQERFNYIRVELEKKNEKLINLRKHTYIACFSEVYNSILMWSHYGNFHKGFCVGYNRESFDRSLPVIYGKKINLVDEKFNINKDFYKYILTKSEKWDYEKEWRIIYKEDKKVCKGLKADSPKPQKIIMGCKINRGDEQVITDFCMNNNINLSKMRMHHEKFELIEDIKFEVI